MKNKILTHYYLKESKKDKEGMIPIYMRITVNGERAEISTNKRVSLSQWDKHAERAAGRSEAARSLNVHLASTLNQVDRIFHNLDLKGDRISVRQVVDELRGKGTAYMTLIQAYEYHLKMMKSMEGIDYAASTVEKYKYSLQSLKEYLKDRLNKSDILLSELDHKFIEGYHNHMRTTGGLMHNSTVKNLKNLIRVINIAIANKWLAVNPFKTFACNYDNNNRSYLTEQEVEAIYSKQFSVDRLSRIRDLFLFQVYTGLSYVDMANLTSTNVEVGIDGNRWLVIHRQKTGSRSSIPILPRALEILNRYENYPKCIVTGRLLPVCSNQRLNGYLKEIADLCRINKPLTTHVARHTFATTITLSSGVPIETVSKMLGHADLKTTQIYSKVVDRKVADDMAHLINQKQEAPKQKRLEG